jgi:hypothetical protein
MAGTGLVSWPIAVARTRASRCRNDSPSTTSLTSSSLSTTRRARALIHGGTGVIVDFRLAVD